MLSKFVRQQVINSAFIFGFICLSFCFSSCKKDKEINPYYRQQMRDFVIHISQYSKAIHPGFAIIPQNGIELITDNNESSGPVNMPYLNAIDGHGQEDMNFGYDTDDKATPTAESDYLKEYLDISRKAGKTILATDYCSTPANMDASYTINSAKNYIGFAADHRELDHIPTYPAQPNNENANNITQLSEAKNFLYIISPSAYATKADFVNAIAATNYDAVILDLYFNEGEALTAADIASIKKKKNGGSRLAICYMSIGEAEDYRYYWQPSFKVGNPMWLDKENPDWPGNFKVHYWEADWQQIIYGNDQSYAKKILDAGFDGAYLDIIEGFEYYE